MAKPGLDGHDRGIKILARAYRDAGMEVIYLGLRQTPSMIVSAAIQEDVDVIAISVLSGAHMTIFPKILELLSKEGINDILLTGGGIIPQNDMDDLIQHTCLHPYFCSDKQITLQDVFLHNCCVVDLVLFLKVIIY